AAGRIVRTRTLRTHRRPPPNSPTQHPPLFAHLVGFARGPQLPRARDAPSSSQPHQLVKRDLVMPRTTLVGFILLAIAHAFPATAQPPDASLSLEQLEQWALENHP